MNSQEFEKASINVKNLLEGKMKKGWISLEIRNHKCCWIESRFDARWGVDGSYILKGNPEIAIAAATMAVAQASAEDRNVYNVMYEIYMKQLVHLGFSVVDMNMKHESTLETVLEDTTHVRGVAGYSYTKWYEDPLGNKERISVEWKIRTWFDDAIWYKVSSETEMRQLHAAVKIMLREHVSKDTITKMLSVYDH